MFLKFNYLLDETCSVLFLASFLQHPFFADLLQAVFSTVTLLISVPKASVIVDSIIAAWASPSVFFVLLFEHFEVDFPLQQVEFFFFSQVSSQILPVFVQVLTSFNSSISTAAILVALVWAFRLAIPINNNANNNYNFFIFFFLIYYRQI